jgi:hypothetical protein
MQEILEVDRSKLTKQQREMLMTLYDMYQSETDHEERQNLRLQINQYMHKEQINCKNHVETLQSYNEEQSNLKAVGVTPPKPKPSKLFHKKSTKLRLNAKTLGNKIEKKKFMQPLHAEINELDEEQNASDGEEARDRKNSDQLR